MTKPVDVTGAEHYRWGKESDGWHLLKRDDLSVILERVPPGESEVRHYHKKSRQFFFLLEGEAVLEIDGQEFRLAAKQGIEVPPKKSHQFRNTSNRDVVFLVISSPKSHGDRVVTEGNSQILTIKKV